MPRCFVSVSELGVSGLNASQAAAAAPAADGGAAVTAAPAVASHSAAPRAPDDLAEPAASQARVASGNEIKQQPGRVEPASAGETHSAKKRKLTSGASLALPASPSESDASVPSGSDSDSEHQDSDADAGPVSTLRQGPPKPAAGTAAGTDDDYFGDVSEVSMSDEDGNDDAVQRRKRALLLFPLPADVAYLSATPSTALEAGAPEWGQRRKRAKPDPATTERPETNGEEERASGKKQAKQQKPPPKPKNRCRCAPC